MRTEEGWDRMRMDGERSIGKSEWRWGSGWVVEGWGTQEEHKQNSDPGYRM